MSEELRRGLVAHLDALLPLSAAVREAFLRVPRELFLNGYVARHGVAAAYRDEAIVTRKNAAGAPTSSSSQPTMMALMLEALQLEPDQRVLEIGAGTGYNAAIMEAIVGLEGRVVTVDVDPETAAGAEEALARAGAQVEVHAADGRDGWPAGAPFDRIVVTASAGEVYRAWWEQLREGGLLEVPLRLGEGVQPVVTFRREGARLVSTGVLCGAFMTLRAADGTALTPPEVSIGGTQDQALRLTGGALGPLSVEARRRLLELVRAKSRGSLPCAEAPYWSLALYLSLTVPPERLLIAWPPHAIGVATADGAALVVARDGEGARAAAGELRLYGTDEAEQDMRDRLAAWEALGKPGEHQLELAVDLADPAQPFLTRRWATGSAGP